MAHFDEDRYALEQAGRSGCSTEHAWTEDPPSRTRHLVTNVRTFAGDRRRRCASSRRVLLFRSRGDDREAEYVCARRRDVLRAGRRRLRLAERRHHRRGGRAAHPEPGDLPVSELTTSRSRSPTSSPPSPCARVETRNGVRLRIESPRLGRSIDLDPLELESLTWQSHDLFTRVPRRPVRAARTDP